MNRYLITIVIGALTANCFGEEPMEKLPKPHYQRKDSDPAWLVYAAQFHGHLGPWATAGARAGMAGLRAIRGEGYFDVEVACEGPFAGPPQSCFLDGIQVATGATMGKRNLRWVKSEEVLVRMKNTRTGDQVEVRPTAVLLGLLGSFAPRPKVQTVEEDDAHDRAGRSEEDPLETIARKIAALPEKEILSVKAVGR